MKFLENMSILRPVLYLDIIIAALYGKSAPTIYFVKHLVQDVRSFPEKIIEQFY